MHLRVLNDVTVVLCLLERKSKKKKTFLCDFTFTTCNTLVRLFFTATTSTVTDAQFSHDNTLEHNTNNIIEHGSSQPSMQKQRSVWCTVDTALRPTSGVLMSSTVNPENLQ